METQFRPLVTKFKAMNKIRALCACKDDFGHEFLVLFTHPETELTLCATVRYDGHMVSQTDETFKLNKLVPGIDELSKWDRYFKILEWKEGTMEKGYTEALISAGFGEWIVI